MHEANLSSRGHQPNTKAGKFNPAEDPTERKERPKKSIVSMKRSETKTSWKCLPLEVRQKILVTAMDDLKHTYRICDYADLWLVDWLPRTRPQVLLKKIVKDAQLASMEEMKHVVKRVVAWRRAEHIEADRKLARLRSEMTWESMLEPRYLHLLDRTAKAKTAAEGLCREVRDLEYLDFRMGHPYGWEL